jgi:hypothetical protein
MFRVEDVYRSRHEILSELTDARNREVELLSTLAQIDGQQDSVRRRPTISLLVWWRRRRIHCVYIYALRLKRPRAVRVSRL